MNSSVSSQEIDGCPGLYVDAFRGKAMWQNIDNADNTLVLSHYHGDHYGQLPRENKYKGPAKIHCTTVTAKLLIYVHQVPKRFVVSHEYGKTWSCICRNSSSKRTHSSPSKRTNANRWEEQEEEEERVRITFYDANHCPGAAIILIEKAEGSCHLHCGDMRFHTRMKAYPLLQRAVQDRRIDLVYLDSTYGHPKHDFPPQNNAIEEIADTVDRTLRKYYNRQERTLVLLSCYSIGKEKVLWRTHRYTQQPIYVNARKYKMLQCLYRRDEKEILDDRCTTDPEESDIHVIPMGLAGELWPYFRPNYKACAEYAEKLTHPYDRIVAFLPTGWAHGSNWNQKNAVTSRDMPYTHRRATVHRIPVEIRLVPYSEHSSFGELMDFVGFLHPRKVVPTVYSDVADRRKIEEHFRNVVDSARAKKHFLSKMGDEDDATTTTRQVAGQPRGATTSETTRDSRKENKEGGGGGGGEGGGGEEEEEEKTRSEAESSSDDLKDSSDLQSLTAMGFDAESARTTLDRCQGNVEKALDELLRISKSKTTKKRDPEPQRKPAARDSKKQKPSTITNFFRAKQRSKP